ncbi:MAG: hypothetical protein FWG19_02825 [Methanomassiliicoccaceae archaeon]|nr:hypothetical protein [Methanomassiliicoccaceae archaeon]
MTTFSYEVFPLRNILSTYPEKVVSEKLSRFSCERDRDVELFLKEKAIVQEKKHISRTYLIFTADTKTELMAYFTIAISNMDVADLQCEDKIRKKMNINKGVAQNYLLGQLGKRDDAEKGLGEFAIEQAVDRILTANLNVGCRVIRVDCKTSLLKYYTENGFVFARHNKDNDLMQMIRIIGTPAA